VSGLSLKKSFKWARLSWDFLNNRFTSSPRINSIMVMMMMLLSCKMLRWISRWQWWKGMTMYATSPIMTPPIWHHPHPIMDCQGSSRRKRIVWAKDWQSAIVIIGGGRGWPSRYWDHRRWQTIQLLMTNSHSKYLARVEPNKS